MDTKSWCQIGYVMKKHGLDGRVKIYLETPLNKEIKTIFIDQNGRPVPFFVSYISILDNISIVKLEEIDTPEKATELAQKPIYLTQELYNKTIQKKDPASIENSIIGYHVFHNAQNIGTVKKINSYAPNPLLIIAGAGKDILIPLNDYFIKEINDDKKTIITALPDGFLTL